MTQTNAYVYAGVWIALGILGTIFQWKQKEKSDAQEKEFAQNKI